MHNTKEKTERAKAGKLEDKNNDINHQKQCLLRLNTALLCTNNICFARPKPRVPDQQLLVLPHHQTTFVQANALVSTQQQPPPFQ